MGRLGVPDAAMFVGATGVALLGKFSYQLEACGGRYGLCTMYIGSGQRIATLERI